MIIRNWRLVMGDLMAGTDIAKELKQDFASVFGEESLEDVTITALPEQDATPENTNHPDRFSKPAPVNKDIAKSTDLALALYLHQRRFDGAECRQVETDDPEHVGFIDFFPSRGESANPGKLVCNRCVQQDWCLGYVLDADEEGGIWGGSTGRERRNISAEYNRLVENGQIDPGELTMGSWAVKNRSQLVRPGNPLGPKTSAKLDFSPRSLKIERANCLDKDSDVFEKIDTTLEPDLTKRDLAIAIAACRTCVFYEYCKEDPIEFTQGQPTVVGGHIQGPVRDGLVPSEKFIKQFMPKIPKPFRAVRQKVVRNTKGSEPELQLPVGDDPVIPKSLFIRLTRGRMLSVNELGELYDTVFSQCASGENGGIPLSAICDFEIDGRETRDYPEESVLTHILDIFA